MNLKAALSAVSTPKVLLLITVAAVATGAVIVLKNKPALSEVVEAVEETVTTA